MIFVRLVIAAAIFIGLFYFVGVGELLKVFYHLDLLYIVYLLGLSVILIWVSSIKWQVFVRESGHDAPIGHLMKLYTVGYFFNTFMPSYVGGDLARSFHLGQYTDSQKDAFAATFLERFTGLLAMCFMGAFFVLIGSEVTKGVEAAVLFVAAGASVLALVCFSEHVSRVAFVLFRTVISKCLKAKYSEKLLRYSQKIEQAMSFGRHNVVLFSKAMFWSFMFHVLGVLNTYVAAKAVGWDDAPLGGLFVVEPLVLLIGMAPITPGGIGLQEGAFLFFLKRIGATHPAALGVGLVIRAKTLIVGLIGGLIWLTLRKQATSSGSC